ncbi:mitochondrial 39-S ribosomal protein L47 (MRP-L47)-domain-containing protein [Cyathus striatus]|nr:mitochondrial 39-S ribosomal protein L47 (MRP-L47)-domain-containing protein [Cyathus striatus]
MLSITRNVRIARSLFQSRSVHRATQNRTQKSDPGPVELVKSGEPVNLLSLLNFCQGSTSSGTSLHSKVPVREDHGLYGIDGEDAYETVEEPQYQQSVSGRAWKASELRLKSFQDLHTLWYVTLRERNLLATQKEEARRMGVMSSQFYVSRARLEACRKTMAHIKAVINERRLAYLKAVELAEKEVEEYHNKVVLQQLQKERKKLLEKQAGTTV